MNAESNAVRALADSGTPGPWECVKGVWAWINVDDDVVARFAIDDDAEKAALAVNALPKVADLVEAVDRDHREFGASCVNCGGEWPCEYAAARDALVAALAVTE